MPVKIRLARRGRRKSPFYHIVIADVRAPRDGKFIEQIGSYNPMTVPATIDVDSEKAIEWINKGAQPTDTVRAMLRFKGVMYRLHLLRGVKKGALTQEQADKLYQEKLDQKQAQVDARVAKTLAEKEDWRTKISGSAKVVAPVAVAADQEAQDAFKVSEDATGEEE